jgi:UrcA family protein
MKSATQLVLALSVSLASIGAPALAEPDAPQSVTIRYGDLDLSQPADASALYARIRSAARQVCAAADAPGAARRVEWSACRREAAERAVTALGSEAVARLHAARHERGARAAG